MRKPRRTKGCGLTPLCKSGLNYANGGVFFRMAVLGKEPGTDFRRENVEVKQETKKDRLEYIHSQGIEEGCEVIDGKGKKFTVVGITKSAELILEGSERRYNPLCFFKE